ncbi:NINE protein [uncultured Helicobacter sp.]|uniref:NINE protein n=1 Tax=uncultured Helicobacter sp. TaxID=175537 RepID=UPI00261476F2|nr:NINE protein [uncultured Helicobacter sp.]
MEQNVVNSLMSQWRGKIPSDSTFGIQEELKSLNGGAERLYGLPLKSKVVGLLLGLFLGSFGADRFYKGDKKLGIYKLALFLAWIIIGNVGVAVGGGAIIGGIAGLLGFALMLWCIADLFLVWKGIPKDNLIAIQQAIANTQ